MLRVSVYLPPMTTHCRINAVSTGQVTGDAYNEGCVGQRGARAWLFVGFMFAFGGLIGSLWIFIQEFLVPGVPLLMQHTLVCLPSRMVSL